ncbi:MAG: hypothetical protein GC149_04690 [Gammaproteobacteria bacterium]|nr:hypothetical protein [Gammaproteobacteria bacterium]
MPYVNKLITLSFLMSFLFYAPGIAIGKTIKDIDVPEQITLTDSSQSLILNGAGIRSKFFFSIYIGALYLPERLNSYAAIIEHDQPRRVMMYCLYHEIEKQKLVDAWNEGFSKNNDEQTMNKLRDRIAEFNKLFPALHTGDVVYLDYIPGKGTSLIFNHKKLGVIPGEDFNTALLKVWLGKHPADASLKDAMLGDAE